MGLYEEPILRFAGDRGLLVELGDEIAPQINKEVRILNLLIQRSNIQGVVETIPTYRSILVYYDPLEIDVKELCLIIKKLALQKQEIHLTEPKLVEIPVCYGGELGPDIEFVAQYHNLAVEDVIRLHSEPLYQIYMMGFTPGFPFLGGLPEILETPRLPTPRLQVPAGSVGIATRQTGIYPITSPGGWNLIGRTPIRLFFPEREEPFLYRPGDLIKFRPISLEEFRDIHAREYKDSDP